MRKAFWSLALAGAAILAAPASVLAQESAETSTAEVVETSPQLQAQTSVPDANELKSMRAEVAAQRSSVMEQIVALQAQADRLDAMERRLSLALGEPPQINPAARPVRMAANSVQSAPQTAAANPQGSVGVAPEVEERQPEIASLGRQGSAITQKGKLSGDIEWSYARADRNRALFRGVEVVESVLIGTFDINESRQDVLQQKVGLQYGLTHDLEIGVDVPFIARWDTSVLTPVAGPNENGVTREIDNSADGYGVGDVTISARKQLLAPKGFGPYLVGNLQVTLPTGTGPFEVARNEFGEAQEASTGSGFYGVTSGITAILPSDPGVLFGSLSYTKNFGGDVDAVIPPVEIVSVDPGDSLSFSAGIGLALNPRLSLNLGYAHSWGFGTETTTRAIVTDGDDPADEVTRTSRDLQVGRFLFGTTYKVDKRTSVNFAIEAGLTDDATDLRMMLRIPFVL
ncbi:MAG: transporter [Erythrobacter sp.]